MAFYPGPAGATESELPLGAWDRIVDANPVLAHARARRRGADRADAGPAAARCRRFLVPIDRCYELVGALRLVWRGFDGGQEARALLDAFFADLAARSRPAREDGAGDGRAVVHRRRRRAGAVRGRAEPARPGAGRGDHRGAGARAGAAGADPDRAAAPALRRHRGAGAARPVRRPHAASPRPSGRSPWLHASTVAQGFTGRTEIDLPLPCTYDFEVSGTTYLHALRDGEIPLLFLFSGTVFTAGRDRLLRHPGAVGPRGAVPAAGRASGAT